jgi:hypothetical protein
MLGLDLKRIHSDAVDIARSVPIETELGRRGVSLRRQGRELVGPCPVCGGTDRFAINIAKQLWNCRGCDKGGDIIDLVQHLDGGEFLDAVNALSVTRPPQESRRASVTVLTAKQKPARMRGKLPTPFGYGTKGHVFGTRRCRRIWPHARVLGCSRWIVTRCSAGTQHAHSARGSCLACWPFIETYTPTIRRASTAHR